MRQVYYVVYLKMRNLGGFYATHEAVLVLDENSKQMFEKVKKQASDVGALSGEQEAKSNPYTEDRHSCRACLETAVKKVRGFMISYGFRMNFAPFKEPESTNNRQVQRYKDQELINQATRLKQMAEQYPVETTASGITPELLTELDAQKECLLSSVTSKQEFWKNHKGVTSLLGSTIEEFLNDVQYVITPYMESKYSQSHPELYADYLKALDVPNPHPTRVSLVGRIVDEVVGIPVSSVYISVDGNKPELKGGKSGGFRFSYLAPGVHELTFQKKGYLETSTRVLILQGQTSHVDVKMRTVSVEEKKEVSE